MPTVSTSSRAATYGSSYKPALTTKRTNLTTQRPAGNLYSNSPSAYTNEALSRALPAGPLGRSTRTLKSDFITKPRSVSVGGTVRVDHAKYSVIKSMYDAATPAALPPYGDYLAKRDSHTLSSSLLPRQQPRTTRSGRASPCNAGRTKNYEKDSIDELMGRNSRSRRVAADANTIRNYSNDREATKDDDADSVSASFSQGCQVIDNYSANSNHPEIAGQATSSTLGSPAEYENGGIVGLKNLGNTCFMNSILQILSHTRILLEYCLEKRYKCDMNKRSSMNGSLISAYADLIRRLWTDISCVSPNSFKSQIQRFAPRFMGYQQQDAQEFLRYLLEGLHEDVNRVMTRPKLYTPNSDEDDKMSDADKAREYWRRYLRCDDSKIVEIFVGQLRSELKFSCGHRSVTFDPFWDLSVSIPRVSYDVSIIDCVTQFMREEELAAAELPTCSTCKARRSCRKSFSIQKFPQILVFHLKRFSQEMFGRKLNTLIEFPATLDLRKFAADRACVNAVYSLYGVCNHSGGTHSGHYTAYTRHPYTGQWHCYNDSRVSATSGVDIASAEAYVLFYELSTPT